MKPKTVERLAQVQAEELIESIPAMPFGPLVMLTGASRLFMNTRMISPKAQRHDGQVVAAQLQGRRTEQHAEGRATAAPRGSRARSARASRRGTSPGWPGRSRSGAARRAGRTCQAPTA